jgi:hypothetical protein
LCVKIFLLYFFGFYSFLFFILLFFLKFSVFSSLTFWLLLVDWLVLGWIGACAPELSFFTYRLSCNYLLFSLFFFVLPFVGLFEQFFFF